MRTILTLTAAALMTPIVHGGSGYELIWEDEFDDLFLNPDNWEAMIGNGQAYGIPGWGNNELQYYTGRPANVSLENGELIITARRESFNGYGYTSARLRTKDRFSFVYGRVEARISVPATEGTWPAFWLLPEDNVYGGWPFSGEIDVMENFANPHEIGGALHFTWPNGAHRFIAQSTGGDFAGPYHTYAIEWEPDQIRWYLDGTLFQTITSDQWGTSAALSDPNAPFDQEFHLLLNMAIGGNPLPNPDGDSPFPQEMRVQYVRVYQLEQAPYHGAPLPIPGDVEAEDFDFGYDGQAYHDEDASNNGGAYRPDSGVDLEICSEGGFNVGWVRPDEWIEYTVDIAQAGAYRIDARVASQSSGGAFRLLFGGQSVGATFGVPVTGGWQNWTTESVEVDLPAGETVMRFENLGGDGDEFNLNRFDFEFVGNDCPSDLAEPFGVLDLADISAFTTGFVAQDPAADFAEPFGVFDLADISAFVAGFVAGCP